MNYLWREIKVKKVINLISSLISKKKRKKIQKKILLCQIEFLPCIVGIITLLNSCQF